MSVKYKDYYKLLGVAKDVTEADLKAAFRKLARKWHPDVNNASNASDKFKEINEAYEVLKDPEKRELYDSFGPNWQEGQNFRPPPGFQGMNMNFGGRGGGNSSVSDFFEAIFGGASSTGGGGGNPFGGGASPFGGGGGRSPFGGGGANPFGGSNPFGGGGNPFGGGHSCSRPPKRKIPSTEADIGLTIEDILKGGKIPVIISDGTSKGSYTITIPKGTTEDTKIRLSGQASNGGNLILKVHINKHEKYSVEKKYNLIVEAEISPSKAALGCKIAVETPEGIVKLTVPPCSSSGGRLRLKEKGLPKKNGKRGHLLVELKIVIPSVLTEEEQELYKKLAELSESVKND